MAFAAALVIPTKTNAASTSHGKCPVGPYLLTGLLLQYAYRFNPLIDVESK